MFELYLNIDPDKYKTVRKVLCLSMDSFAELAHVTRQTVYNFEKGETASNVTIGMALMLKELSKKDSAASVVWETLIEEDE